LLRLSIFLILFIVKARLINLHADEGECIFDLAVCTDNSAVSNALINLVEHASVLSNVDASAPLVGNAEEHLLELTVGELGAASSIVNPFLGNCARHFCFTVEGSEHAVDASEEIGVLGL
jgi:hypothetical protein